jgi:fructosamine-3-kinase
MAACWQLLFGHGAMAAAPIDALDDWLRDQLGRRLVDRRSVGGGCIHRAWQLRFADGGVLFAKTNTAAALPQLVAEAEGLLALAAHAPAGLVIPEPLATGIAGDQAVLVLPWLDLEAMGGGAGQAGAAFQFGQHLARLHRASAARSPGQGYGWPADNFIGSAPQANGWQTTWGVFFAQCRLAPQLAWAARQNEPLEGAAALLELVPRWLAETESQPVLVHGDLWCGNAALLADGRGVVFDPACYWGDREVDLAMAQLFGGFSPSFFEGYSSRWPLPPGARERVALYNLYHLLNHANLFGGGYWPRAQACLVNLLSRVA